MAFSNEIKAIIDQKVNRLESVPLAFSERMVQIQKNTFVDIVSLLDELDYSGGNIVINNANLLRIEQIVEQAKDLLTTGEFETVVGELLNEFDVQAETTYKYFNEAFEGFEVPAIANDMLAQKKREAVVDLLNSTDQYLTNPMRQSLSNAVTTGASRKDVIGVFRELILGDEETVGRLERATRQIVSDTFALSDRAVTNAVAEQLDFQWFFYVGGLLDTTRPFCKARNGKYFRKSEVESWGALGDWAGKMAGTNEKTIFVTAGGYNCQHSILPVSESVVPERFKNQAKSNVSIDIRNDSGFDLDIKSINQHARLKANEYGLTDNFVIEISKSKNVGGGVSFKKVSNDLSKFDNKVEIYTDGTLTKKQYNQIINHELRHVQQGQLDRLQMIRNKSGRWYLYWEGKRYMSATEYEKLTKRITNPRLSASKRAEAFNKYANLPWEKEAFDNDGTF